MNTTDSSMAAGMGWRAHAKTLACMAWEWMTDPTSSYAL
jgi:hypothetical protein